MIRNKSKTFQPKNAKKKKKKKKLEEPGRAFRSVFYEVADLQLYQKKTPHTNNNFIKNDFGLSPFL